MPRELKPYEVDEVTANGERLPVFFDRNRKVFFASIGMERVEHTDLVEAKKLAVDLLDRAPKYDWVPTIVVSRIAEEERERGYGRTNGIPIEGAGVSLTFYRTEIARSPVQKKKSEFMRLFVDDFEAEMREELRRAPFGRKRAEEDVARRRFEREKNRRLSIWWKQNHEILLPYSSATWEALKLIERSIEEARRSLASLISRDDLAERLVRLVVASSEGAPPRLLPAGLERPTRAEARRRAASSRA